MSISVDGDAVAKNLFSRESSGVFGLDRYLIGFRCICGEFGHCIVILKRRRPIGWVRMTVNLSNSNNRGDPRYVLFLYREEVMRLTIGFPAPSFMVSQPATAEE